MQIVMSVRDVEDLEVYRRAYRLSLEVHKASLTFPKIEQHALADQVRRASKSICGNLAEGLGKQSTSRSEFVRYVRIAMGSTDEMRVWSRNCLDLGNVDDETYRRWTDEFRAIARTLQGLQRARPDPASDI